MKTDPSLDDTPKNNPGRPEGTYFSEEDFRDKGGLFLNAILKTMPESIYFKDRDSKFLCVSQSHCDKCAMITQESHIGKSDFDLFSEEHAQQAYDDEQRIIQTGQPIFDAEEKETWPDGTVTWVSTTKMPLYAENGEIIGTFGVSRDITQRKKAESDLRATQKELLEASRLAGMAEISTGILHNIGNALNSVNTSASLLYGQIENSRLVNLSKVAAMINENADHLASFLTTDDRGKQLPAYILQLSAQLEKEHKSFLEEINHLRKSVEHINSVVAMQQAYSRAPDVSEDADAVELIEEALQISEISLSRHGVDVVRDFAPVPPIHVTRHKVLVILINFIRNAKYAMDDSGREKKEMTILVRQKGGEVHLIVRDNGIGIAPEAKNNIFNFGFTTREGGHGFGLHSSANAASELGASISFESEGIGKGATFTLAIPLAPREPKSRAKGK